MEGGRWRLVQRKATHPISTPFGGGWFRSANPFQCCMLDQGIHRSKSVQTEESAVTGLEGVQSWPLKLSMRINECVCIHPCSHKHTLTHTGTYSLGLTEDQLAFGLWLVGLGRRPIQVLMTEIKTMHAAAGRAVWRSVSAPRIVPFPLHSYKQHIKFQTASFFKLGSKGVEGGRTCSGELTMTSRHSFEGKE